MGLDNFVPGMNFNVGIHAEGAIHSLPFDCSFGHLLHARSGVGGDSQVSSLGCQWFCKQKSGLSLVSVSRIWIRVIL